MSQVASGRSRKRVAGWSAAIAAMTVIFWFALSYVATVVTVTDLRVPDAAELQRPPGVVLAETSTIECGQANCRRQWVVLEGSPHGDEASKCTGVNFLPFRKVCQSYALQGEKRVLFLYYST